MRKEVVLGLVLLLVCINFVSGLNDALCARMEVTSIEPSSVEADEDFTVGIQIENCGTELPENVTFEITRHSEDIYIKEPLVTEVGKIGYSNSKRFLLYHMRTLPSAKPGQHVFETKLTYGRDGFNIEKEDNFSVTVSSEISDIAISSVKTNPVIVNSGDIVTLIIEVENAGKGDAKDVRVELEGLDFKGVKQVYLGKIESDESVPARFILEADKKGMQEFSAVISYKENEQEMQETFPLEVQVFSSGYFWYWVLGVIIVLAGVIYYIYSVRKDQQNKNLVSGGYNEKE